MNCLMVFNLTLGSYRPMCITSCPSFNQVVENIITASREFEYCWFINDIHSVNDIEFNYLPPHSLESGTDTSRLFYQEDKIHCKYKQFFTKRSLSALDNNHLKMLMLASNFNEICLSGFSTTLDIVPTAISLINFHPRTYIAKSCVGDISDEHQRRALDYIRVLGVPIG